MKLSIIEHVSVVSREIIVSAAALSGVFGMAGPCLRCPNRARVANFLSTSLRFTYRCA